MTDAEIAALVPAQIRDGLRTREIERGAFILGFKAALALAANASASPALASEGLAGLSQAYGTMLHAVSMLDHTMPQIARQALVDGLAELRTALDAVRESRESRPPVATSDHEACPSCGSWTRILTCYDPFHAGPSGPLANLPDTRKGRNEPERCFICGEGCDALTHEPASRDYDHDFKSPAAPAESVASVDDLMPGRSRNWTADEQRTLDAKVETVRQYAAKTERCAFKGIGGKCGASRQSHESALTWSHAFQAESVEEPRCAYVWQNGGGLCGNPLSWHDDGTIQWHPFTAVPPVARESDCQCGFTANMRFPHRRGAVGCQFAVAREENPHICKQQRCEEPHDAPAASPRRAQIETPHKFTSPTGYGQCTECDYVEDKPWHRKATAIEKVRETGTLFLQAMLFAMECER